MSRATHPQRFMVNACPECDSTNIWQRGWKEGGVPTTDADAVACYDCGAEFGQPVERPSKNFALLAGDGDGV